MATIAPDPVAQRKRDLTRIHVLRGALRLSEDDYRGLIADLFAGKSSSTELTTAERARFVAHLVVLDTKRRQAAGAGPARPPLTPKQRKMFSLWQQLCDVGLARDRGMPALQTWVQHQTRVDRWEWLTGHQEDTVIESLKRWLKRAGAGVVVAAVQEPGHG